MSAQQVNIIAGQWKGRKIKFPNQPGLRPTSARLRETLFNWLAPHIQGAKCLDLFAGSGALSWEALSRGASEASLLETDRRVVNALRDSSKMLGCEASVTILTMDALVWSERQIETPDHTGFDILFVDPPFTHDCFELVLHNLRQLSWMSSDVLVYLEAPVKADLASLECHWSRSKQTRVGDVQAFLLTPI